MKRSSKKVISVCISTLLLTNTIGPAALPLLGTTSAIAIGESIDSTIPAAVSPVTALLGSGTYTGNQKETLTLNADYDPTQYVIRYSIGEASVLTSTSTKYTTPIDITGDKVIKYAVFDLAGNIVSGSETVNTYKILPNLQTSLAGGSYNSLQTIKLEDNVKDYWIWYTLDGSDPVPGNANTYQNVATGFTLSNEGTYNLRFASFLKVGTKWEMKGDPLTVDYVIDKTVSAPEVQAMFYKEGAINGKVEAGATVTAKVNTIVIGTGIADGSGNFTIPVNTDYPMGTEISITQTDAAKNTSTATSIVVGNIISNDNIPEGYFNLNSSLPISYNLARKAYVTVAIYQGDKLIKTINNNILKSNDVTNTTYWDGKDESGVKAAPGDFVYKINAADENGNQAIQKTGTFTASKAPVISNVIVDSSSLLTKLSYDLDIPSKVSISIYDSRGQLVKDLITNSEQNGSNVPVIWDTSQLGDGVFTYRINAVDSKTGTFNAPQKIGTITIERAAPTITNVTPASTPDNIYAHDLGRGNMSIGYNLSEDAEVNVEIKQGTTTIRTIGPIKRYVGENSVSWDGKDNNSILVGAGQYTYVITAKDNGGNEKVIDPTVFKISKTPVITVNSTTSINKIDSSNPKAAIDYDLDLATGGKASVTVGIYNKLGQLVKENIYKDQEAGNKYEWDGTIIDGSNIVPVADGIYTYKISAVDNTAQFASVVKSGSINVERNAVSVTNVTPTEGYTYDLGRGNMVIGYNLSEDANVTLDIKEGTTIKRTIILGNKNAGANTVSWDGKDGSQTLLPAGTYNFTITAKDSSTTTSETINFKLSKTPVITVDTTNSDTRIDSSINDKASIKYDLSTAPSGIAKVTLGIYNKQGLLVKEYIKEIQGTTTGILAEWDGTDGSSNLVGDGIYTYKISAVDNTAQFSSLAKSGTITVERAAVLITDVTPADDYSHDLARGNMMIGYTLSEDAYVTVDIKQGDTIVRTIGPVKKYAGSNTLLWDGKDKNLVLLPANKYSFTITANDSATTPTVKTVNFKLSKTPVITVNNTNSDTLINSNSDTASIKYDLSTAPMGTAKVNVGIYNKQGVLVREYITDNQGSATGIAAGWDGNDNNNTPVGDGIYTYKINAVDNTAQFASLVKSGTITVERAIPVISDVFLSKTPYNPILGALRINYGLSEDAYVTVKIIEKYDSSGNPVYKTILNNVKKLVGSNYVTWDGKNSSGILVSTGEYKCIITGVDMAGKIGNNEVVISVVR